MKAKYDVGDAPTARARFYDADGVLGDPTLVTVEMLDPSGVQTTLAGVLNPEVGVYDAIVPTLTLPGRYIVKFFGTGNLVSAEEASFTVRASRIS